MWTIRGTMLLLPPIYSGYRHAIPLRGMVNLITKYNVFTPLKNKVDIYIKLEYIIGNLVYCNLTKYVPELNLFFPYS